MNGSPSIERVKLHTHRDTGTASPRLAVGIGRPAVGGHTGTADPSLTIANLPLTVIATLWALRVLGRFVLTLTAAHHNQGDDGENVFHVIASRSVVNGSEPSCCFELRQSPGSHYVAWGLVLYKSDKPASSSRLTQCIALAACDSIACITSVRIVPNYSRIGACVATLRILSVDELLL